jgi:HEAT repeat protein
MTTKTEIKQYLLDLENDDIRTREIARWELVSIGPQAVPGLVRQLKTDDEHCRWEAAKILGDIHTEAAALALVEALADDSLNVHWAASESLIKYGREAVLPLLEGMTHHFNSPRFRQGVYHVLHTLERAHQLDPQAQEVLDALRNIESSASAPWAAERAIEYYKYQKK